MALIECMRLSLRKGAQVVLFGAAWQEIRVRSGRDDKVSVASFRDSISQGNTTVVKLVIPTGA